MEVELNMQYSGHISQDLFETYKRFLRCIYTEFERKVDVHELGGNVFRIGFLKLLKNDDEK